MTNVMCTDNRFEVIAKAKEKIVSSTNIENSPKEMEVLDDILFRMWQCDFLDKGWHTGTPTEEGWYLLALTTKVFNDKPFCVAYMDGHHWLGIDDFCIFVDHVLAWQKIEPYEASKERE